VPFWLVTGLGWGIVAVALIGIAKIPGRSLDLYFSDRYVPVSKRSMVMTVTVVLVMPLAAATIRHLRSPRP
jgi:hypothetical protein